RRRLPLEVVFSAVADACDGLAHVHDYPADDGSDEPAGWVHRDISPENLVLGTDGVTRLVDFGVATGDRVGATRAGHMKGKIHYMAPEVFRGETAEPGRDVYAIGVTLYELATGARPFRGENDGELMYQIANADPASPSRLRPELPRSLDELFSHATHRDAGKRCDAITLGEGVRALLPDQAGQARSRAVRAAVTQLLSAPARAREPTPAERESLVGRSRREAPLRTQIGVDVFTVSRPVQESADIFSHYGRTALRKAPRHETPPTPKPAPQPELVPGSTMPDAVRYHFERGMRFRRQGQFEAALAEWEAAASLQPSNRILMANVRLMRKKLRR
ncbi:MAG: serine/threonine-protein kinase, partial [Myxococcota bacterium]